MSHTLKYCNDEDTEAIAHETPFLSTGTMTLEAPFPQITCTLRSCWLPGVLKSLVLLSAQRPKSWGPIVCRVSSSYRGSQEAECQVALLADSSLLAVLGASPH